MVPDSTKLSEDVSRLRTDSYALTMRLLFMMKDYIDEHNLSWENKIELIFPVFVNVIECGRQCRIFNLNVTSVKIYLEGYELIDDVAGVAFHTDMTADSLLNYTGRGPDVVIGNEIIRARAFDTDIARVIRMLEITIDESKSRFPSIIRFDDRKSPAWNKKYLECGQRMFDWIEKSGKKEFWITPTSGGYLPITLTTPLHKVKIGLASVVVDKDVLKLNCHSYCIEIQRFGNVYLGTFIDKGMGYNYQIKIFPETTLEIENLLRCYST